MESSTSNRAKEKQQQQREQQQQQQQQQQAEPPYGGEEALLGMMAEGDDGTAGAAAEMMDGFPNGYMPTTPMVTAAMEDSDAMMNGGDEPTSNNMSGSGNSSGGSRGVMMRSIFVGAEERTKTERAQLWTMLSLSGMMLPHLSPSLFKYRFITALYLQQNHLSFLPPSIGNLRSLVHLDVSQNKLQELPAELGLCAQLKELLLRSNQLNVLPPEIGYLGQLYLLDLENNPLIDPFRSLKDEGAAAIVLYLRDHIQQPSAPADRQWIRLTADSFSEMETFTVLCQNILSDSLASPHAYSYCPTWALDWKFRRGLIIEEILTRRADIVCLQEVEYEQFEVFFKKALAPEGYVGVFRPKSRAKNMTEADRSRVDGCATFFLSSRFKLIEETVIEFAVVATSRADPRKCPDIFNRVMPKDNIALVTVLQSTDDGRSVLVANPHLTWDPEFADVKLVQAAVLMSELSKIYRNYPDVPVVICGDFNSLPDSGVHQFMSKGSLPKGHPDFRSYDYDAFTSDALKHDFSLRSAYSYMGELPFTNYTATFSGVIDYIFFSNLTLLDLLGPVQPEYMSKIVGFPNVHFPSDHISLGARFRFPPDNGGRAGGGHHPHHHQHHTHHPQQHHSSSFFQHGGPSSSPSSPSMDFTHSGSSSTNSPTSSAASSSSMYGNQAAGGHPRIRRALFK